MDDSVWKIFTPICVVAAIVLVAAKTKGRSPGSRVFFSLLAAVAVGGAMGVARPLVGKLLFSSSDDYAWSTIKEMLAKQYPEMGEMFTLGPDVESGFRSAVLPVLRNHSFGDPKLIEALTIASVPIYGKLVFPIAIFGSDEAIAGWGSPNLTMLQAIAAISPEACGDFALNGVNRYSPNARIDAAVRSGHRALIDAYRTSDRTTNPLPSQSTIQEAYAKAVNLAQPPFSSNELTAMETIEKLPKAQVCNLMIRLLGAIEKLDAKSKAVIYRSMMKDRL